MLLHRTPVWFIFLFLVYHVSGSLSTQNSAVNQYIESAIAKFKLKLHQASQRHEGRSRRSLASPGPLNASNTELHLSSIKPVGLINSSQAAEIQPFQIGVNQYIAVVNQGMNSASEIYQLKNGGRLALVQRFTGPVFVDFQFLDFGREKYVAFVENSGKGWDGQTSYARLVYVFRYVPSFTGNSLFHFAFHIEAHGGTSVKGFLHNENQYYVIANSRSDKGSCDVHSTLYVKTANGLLNVQTFETQGAEDVEVFVIRGLVYLVFANHRNAHGMVDIYSKIYREQSSSESGAYISFEYIQSILTHGARDVEYFEMKNHYYIVVANEFSQLISYKSDLMTKSKRRVIVNDYEVDSVIYWWSGSFFVEWQRIPTSGAMKWEAFTGPMGEQFLVVANSKSQAVIYAYDHQSGLFKPTGVQGVNPFPSSAHIPDVRSVKAFSLNEWTYLAVANFNKSSGNNLFRLNFTYNDVPKAGPSVDEKLLVSIDEIKARMNKVREWSTKLQNCLHKIMTVGGNQTAFGAFSFKSVTVNNMKIQGNLIYKEETRPNLIQSAVQNSINLQKILTIQIKKIKELERRLNDSVSPSKSNEVVGEKIFKNKVKFDRVTVSDSMIGTINGINLTDLNQRAWSKSKAQLITGSTVFMRDVKILGDLEVAGSVNGVQIPEDIMTTNTDQRIYGRKVFIQPVELQGNLVTVNATVNGLRIPEDLVLRNTRQTIFGRTVFNGTLGVKKSIVVNGLTNGRDLSEFSKRVVTLSTDQVITGAKTFLSGFGVEGNLDVSGLVDGVNLTELDLDAARINQREIIRGRKTITGSVNVMQNLEAKSSINGVRLQDDVMTTKTNQTINVKKTFTNVNVKGDVITSSTINGIDLSEEAVTKSGDQTILGRKTFIHDVTVDGNIDVTGTADGVNISQLVSSAMRRSGENIVTAHKIFTGKISVGNISIRGSVNGINLTRLRNEIWTVDGNHVITAPMTFENVVVKSNLVVNGTVNGAKLPTDFTLLNDMLKVDNDLVFKDDVVFQCNVNFGGNSSLNGEHFPTFLRSVVLNGTKQEIRGKKCFKHGFFVRNDITANGTINGCKVPDDFVTLDTVQNITGTKTFLNGVAVNGSLHSGIINVSSTVNGVDISKLSEGAVYRGRNQTVTGTVVFTGNVSILGPLKIAGLIDGVNVTELEETAVLLSKPQLINGKKLFVKDVEFHAALKTPGLINKVNLQKIQENSLKKTGDQFISGTKIFENSIFIGGNLANGTINKVNLRALKRSIVTKNSIETINGDITFLQNVSCAKLSLNGTIDGISLDDILLTFGNQIVRGEKVFNGNITVSKNLTVEKLINGIDINLLEKDIMKIVGDQNSTAKLIFKSGFNVGGSVHIEGLVNGVDVAEMNRSAVRIDGAEMINGVKTFIRNITVNGNVKFEETLNDINITNLLTDVMSISKDQTITGKKTFTSKGGIRFISSLKSKNIILNGLINGINITDIDRTAVTLSGDQELNGVYIFMNDTIFEGNVEIKGLLNGINISSDVLLTYSDQYVTGFKKFVNLVVNGSIHITGRVDGVDVSEFAKSRVTLSTNQTIYGRKIFASDVTMLGDVELPNGATVNNIDLSKEVLCIDDNPLLINGTKIFTEQMVIEGDLNVTGLVQGLNITELGKKIVRIDNVKVLTGKNTFTKNVTVVGNITCLGYINGVKIKELVSETEKFKKSTGRVLSFLNRTVNPICKKLNVLLNLNGLEKRIDGLEQEHELALPQGGLIDTINIDDEVFLAVARPVFSGCGQAYIVRCNAKLKCKIHQQITTRAVFVQFFKQSGQSYLFVGHYGNSSIGCPSYPEIFKFEPITGAFLSEYNVTGSLYTSHQSLSSSDIVVQNIASLIPSAVLNSPPQSSPIDALGTLVSTIPALSRVFVVNGTTYLVRAHAWTNFCGIEVFIIDRSSLVAIRLQRIATGEVLGFEIGYLEGRMVLVVAERRPPENEKVKLYSFIEERRSFFYYKRIHVGALAVNFATIIDTRHFIFTNPNTGFGLCPWKGVLCFDECMVVQDYGIKHVTQVSTSEGVFIVGITNTHVVIYKLFIRGVAPEFKGKLNCSP